MTSIVATVALTASFIAGATGGRIAAGAADAAFTSVSIDSRALETGALFVPLAGTRADGHAFIDDAVAHGAAGVLAADLARAARAPIVIHVDDTLLALQALGREVRRRSGADVVAITGSAGKTTTKEATAALLSARYTVFRNAGNLNNHIGLPLSLIELRHGPDIAVVELGMNHPGEIRALVAIAEPRVRVWTNVGDAHIGYFGSREAVADAKAEVLEQPVANSVVVANADDPLVMARVAGYRDRVVTFGEHRDATVRAAAVEDRGLDGTAVAVHLPGSQVTLDVALPGRVHLSNILAAVAVAWVFDVPAADIEGRVQTIQPVARRGASRRLADGTRVVDDSYNASPVAVQGMLSALARTPTAGRRVAVLGEMLELGALARELHDTCGRAAAGVDVLVAIGGPDAEAYGNGAIAAGLPRARVHRYRTSAEAADAIGRIVVPGDLVLVKGSRGTRTDLVADRLAGVA